MRGATFDPTQNKALLSELDILKEFKKLWADELMRAAENRDAVGSYTESQVIKLSEKETGKDSIKTQLRSNLDKLRDMSPVASVDYESIKHLNRAEKAKVIMDDYNKKFKGGIERKILDLFF